MKKISNLTKKIFIIIIAFTIGLLNVYAEKTLNSEEIQKYKDFFDNEAVPIYQYLAIQAYYYNISPSIIQSNNNANNQEALRKIWQNGYDQICTSVKCNFDLNIPEFNKNVITDNKKTREFINEMLAYLKLKFESGSLLDKFVVELSQNKGKNAINDMLNVANNHLEATARLIDNINSGISNTKDDYYTKKYKSIVNDIVETYKKFCDFLDDHAGTKYYISKALELFSYISLVLVAVLGALDFITAIASQDDGALKKAWQRFTRRLVAVVVIFLSYVIVQLVFALIQKNSTGISEGSAEMCEAFKLGKF